jgi:hypothetical protein
MFCFSAKACPQPCLYGRVCTRGSHSSASMGCLPVHVHLPASLHAGWDFGEVSHGRLFPNATQLNMAGTGAISAARRSAQ